MTDSYEFQLKNRRYNGRNYFDVPISNYVREHLAVHKNGLGGGDCSETIQQMVLSIVSKSRD